MKPKCEIQIERIDKYRWKIPMEKYPGMRVPGIIYADDRLMAEMQSGSGNQAPVQVANVAHLPGIVKASFAMPDIHWGYGFPIGGVAATNLAEGVISPGGVGYDISCGIRLVRTNLKFEEIKSRIAGLVESLFHQVPCGVGSSGKIKLSPQDMDSIFRKGVRWAVEHGFGDAPDIEVIEDRGCIPEADAEQVSNQARQRGRDQLGTLGAGNHFIEIQEVEEIYDEDAARAFGLELGQITVMLHSGSRGLGHQVCTDFLVVMQDAARKYQISLPDAQLACAPISSPEGKRYLGAMAAAANFGMTNREVLTHLVRETVMRFFNLGPKDLGLELVYDLCHNIAKMEEHLVEGKKMTVCVHRKGATRAFPAGHPNLPQIYAQSGQPVLVPGDMGRASYILVGLPKAMDETFGSTCHGAGRAMSREAAKRLTAGRALKRELEDKGIAVRCVGRWTLAEETPEAYKDVSQVVDVVEQAGLSKKVAKLRPIGVVKG
ncbi:MAG: RtcB family protein [bacterium]|nr:RtcB family protein [bacterium]